MASSRPVAPVATLTLNPSLDLSFSVEALAPGRKLRCHSPRLDAGGGGINVARVIRRLGGKAVAVLPLGGANGQKLRALLTAERMPFIAQEISGETREDFTAEVRATGDEYRFVMPGPRLSPADRDGLMRTAEAVGSRVLVASGSLAPGVPVTFYGRLAERAAAAGVKMALDASGAALRHGVAAGVWLVKPNLDELEELAGAPLPSLADRLAACRAIIARGGAEIVALSMGADGALLVTAERSLAARAPTVTPVSTVGAGDSFMGGLVRALADGSKPDAALRLAVAAGSAALLAPGTQLSRAADVRRLTSRVCVNEI
jgi:6-phosphofructokinase 2